MQADWKRVTALEDFEGITHTFQKGKRYDIPPDHVAHYGAKVELVTSPERAVAEPKEVEKRTQKKKTQTITTKSNV